MVLRPDEANFGYFAKREWGEAFIEGDVRFKSLSYYHQIEDGAVRGDGNEGSIYTQPETGLVMHNRTQGCTRVIPGAFQSFAKSDEIFILCASNSMKEELQVRFEAECCVEILKVADLCARIEASGALGVAKSSALELVGEAKERLGPLGARQRAALELVADGVVERYA